MGSIHFEAQLNSDEIVDDFDYDQMKSAGPYISFVETQRDSSNG